MISNEPEMLIDESSRQPWVTTNGIPITEEFLSQDISEAPSNAGTEWAGYSRTARRRPRRRRF